MGDRIRRLRLERGLSQRQVSGPGATYAYVSRIEAGSRNPTIQALAVIAAKLGVSAEYLATGEYRDPLTRLYAVATKRERERLDDFALRAGLLWMCGDPDCEWLNREETTRCTACGKLLNPAFQAAMEAGGSRIAAGRSAPDARPLATPSQTAFEGGLSSAFREKG